MGIAAKSLPHLVRDGTRCEALGARDSSLWGRWPAAGGSDEVVMQQRKVNAVTLRLKE